MDLVFVLLFGFPFVAVFLLYQFRHGFPQSKCIQDQMGSEKKQLLLQLEVNLYYILEHSVNQKFEETKKGYEKPYLERQKIQFFNKNIKTNDGLQTTKPNTKD